MSAEQINRPWQYSLDSIIRELTRIEDNEDITREGIISGTIESIYLIFQNLKEPPDELIGISHFAIGTTMTAIYESGIAVEEFAFLTSGTEDEIEAIKRIDVYMGDFLEFITSLCDDEKRIIMYGLCANELADIAEKIVTSDMLEGLEAQEDPYQRMQELHAIQEKLLARVSTSGKGKEK